jgi:hypothetical protein
MVRKMGLKDAKFDFSFFINAPRHNYPTFFALMWLLVKTNFILPRRKFMHVSVNVTRIEPHTELFNLAVKEGTLSGTANLLPDNENLLPSLYYHNPDIRFAEGIFRFLLKVKETIKGMMLKDSVNKGWSDG